MTPEEKQAIIDFMLDKCDMRVTDPREIIAFVQAMPEESCSCPDFEITTDYPPSIIRYNGFTFRNQMVSDNQIAKRKVEEYCRTAFITKNTIHTPTIESLLRWLDNK